MDTTIASRVQSCLDQAGKTQKELAKELKLTPSQMSKCLGGSRQFTTTELATIADIFDVSMYWLATGTEDPSEFRLVARHLYDSDNQCYTAENIAYDQRVLNDITLIYRQVYA